VRPQDSHRRVHLEGRLEDLQRLPQPHERGQMGCCRRPLHAMLVDNADYLAGVARARSDRVHCSDGLARGVQVVEQLDSHVGREGFHGTGEHAVVRDRRRDTARDKDREQAVPRRLGRLAEPLHTGRVGHVRVQVVHDHERPVRQRTGPAHQGKGVAVVPWRIGPLEHGEGRLAGRDRLGLRVVDALELGQLKGVAGHGRGNDRLADALWAVDPQYGR